MERTMMIAIIAVVGIVALVGIITVTQNTGVPVAPTENLAGEAYQQRDASCHRSCKNYLARGGRNYENSQKCKNEVCNKEGKYYEYCTNCEGWCNRDFGQSDNCEAFCSLDWTDNCQSSPRDTGARPS